MAIKSDKWIKKMAVGMKMINPFQESQVKYDDQTDQKLISYGLSSYGYDVRLSLIHI